MSNLVDQGKNAYKKKDNSTGVRFIHHETGFRKGPIQLDLFFVSCSRRVYLKSESEGLGTLQDRKPSWRPEVERFLSLEYTKRESSRSVSDK